VLLGMVLAVWLFGTADLSALSAAALALTGESEPFNLPGAAGLLLAAGVVVKGLLLPLVASRESPRQAGEPLAVAIPTGMMLAAAVYVVLRNASLFHHLLTHLPLSSWWLPLLALALAL